jgi:hypothetical protein
MQEQYNFKGEAKSLGGNELDAPDLAFLLTSIKNSAILSRVFGLRLSLVHNLSSKPLMATQGTT